MRRRFPDADACVFGHSHIPLHEEATASRSSTPAVPPTAAASPDHTMGLVRVEDGRVAFELVVL